MSLNRKEIDLILSEWQFANARIQEIYQPNIQTLYMELYIHGALQRIHVYLSQAMVRLHSSAKKLIKPSKPQRFQQLLQSKVIGMYIKDIVHMDNNRIVKMHLVRNINRREKPQSLCENYVKNSMMHRYLYFKLWSNNVNIIYTDEKNTIIDLLYRSPKQNLIPKQLFTLPKNPPSNALSATTIRTWQGQSFNQYIEKYYKKKHEHCVNKTMMQEASLILKKRILYLHIICVELKNQMNGYSDAQLYTEYGNAILQNASTITGEDSLLHIPCNGENTKKTIPLDNKQSAIENAQRYFKKAKKAKKAATARAERYKICEAELKNVEELQSLLSEYTENENEKNSNNYSTLAIPERVLEYVRNHHTKSSIQREEKRERKKNGIFLQKGKFTIAIGRNAIESDLLLRTYARGEDIWMHALGIKGSFVFLRCPRATSNVKNKQKIQSAPLEILLDCARIAVMFSKAKNETYVDVTYTKVKYLRRIKNSIAQVIPTNTKTLRVQAEKEKIQAFISMYEIR